MVGAAGFGLERLGAIVVADGARLIADGPGGVVRADGAVVVGSVGSVGSATAA